MTKTYAEIARDRDDVAMIEHPEYWPGAFYLALKHRTEWAASRDVNGGVGYLLAGTTTPYRVYRKNLLLMSPDDPFTDYPSAAALVADGWRVD